MELIYTREDGPKRKVQVRHKTGPKDYPLGPRSGAKKISEFNLAKTRVQMSLKH